jgi:glutamine synthetase
MQQPAGNLTVQQLGERADAKEIDTVLVVFTDLYGRLVGKRFDVRFFLDHVGQHGTHACDYLLTVDMEMDPTSGYKFANWDRGYGDFHLVPDLRTLRVAAWLDRTAIVLCDVQDDATHALVPFAPRSLLRQQMARLDEAGYEARAGSELEYYLFRTSYRDAARGGYSDAALEPAGWYIEDYHALQGTRAEPFHGEARRRLGESGVVVECTKGEWGKGQHELNLHFTEVLEMADRQALLKQCLKEIAERQGVSVTFMAKFAADAAGCSCHLHISLWRGGDNVFAGDDLLSSIRCAPLFRWFLAGWMEHLPDLMPFYAPTVNSYKRYQAGSWAPTRIAWSRDNRTVGFRVVGAGPSLRIECRVPGADCNSYLAYAAALASGIDGIHRQLEPRAEFVGNAYTADQALRVPATLQEAADRLSSSAFAREAFGADVVEHYVHFFRTEQAAYDRAVTDWERRRYFERI